MSVKAGSFVKVKHGGKIVKGKVTSVHTSSSTPAVANDPIAGTEDAPAVRLQHYTQAADGSYSPTATHTAHLMSAVTPIAPLFGKKRSALGHPVDQPASERRMVQVGEVRVVPEEESDGKHQFWARVVNYNVVDDYGTTFGQGAFNESLTGRMPRYLYGHAGWSMLGNVIGRGVDYRDQSDGLDVLFELDDFDPVPSARQVWAQLQSGTLDQFSVGFERLADEKDPNYEDNLNVIRITKARLFEVSSVIEGAVPGTKILAMSRAARTDPQAAVIMNYLEGRASFDEAQAALAELQEVRAPGDEDDVAQWIASIDATLDEALGYLNGIADPEPEVAQARDLVSAASELIDQLMDAMGIADPDDSDDTGSGGTDNGSGNLAPPERAAQHAAAEAEALSALEDRLQPAWL